MDTYLPPKYSLNSFFVRHVAHPRRMKVIQGLNNSKICAVNDVGYLPGLTPGASKSSFPPNNFNEELIRSDSFKRKEKAVPPNGIWQTFGLIDNTDKWRSELNELATSIGLLTQNDIEDLKKRKEKSDSLRRVQEAPSFIKPATSQSKTLAVTPAKRTASSRLNEPLLTGRRSKHFSRGSRGFNLTGSNNFVVDSAEREAWMLQVLCQILQTDNLTDVQSWLVSATNQEKERVRQLIDQAMRGLEESGRIGSNSSSELYNKPQSSYNEQTKMLQNVQDGQSSLIEIENALHKFKVSKSDQANKYSSDKSKGSNVLKIDDDEDNSRSYKHKLEPISEAVKVQEENNFDEPLTASTIFKINMQDQANGANNTLNQFKKLPPLENTVVKIETPTPNKDYKIEKVKVTMLVKDEKSKSLQEISGDWNPVE